MKYTVFLDRDGVINQDSPDYIKEPSEFYFIPRSDEALGLLTRAGFDVIVITNQSAVGRKMVTLNCMATIFDKMKKGGEQYGGHIKDIFYCPHTPDDGCDCRKPEPGLIFQAKAMYSIDLAFSCMVGDSAKDVICGKNAGCAQTVLVRTGNGCAALQELEKKGVFPDYVAADLMDATCWIRGHHR